MRFIIFSLLLLSSSTVFAGSKDACAIKRAVKDYIESQHNLEPEMMARGIDKSLAKRTYWRKKSGKEVIIESTFEDMVELATTYNQFGDRFPELPLVDIQIYDIDQRVASVKLTADDWIDYMHLYKNEDGNWKVLNVLWQFHKTQLHTSVSNKSADK